MMLLASSSRIRVLYQAIYRQNISTMKCRFKERTPEMSNLQAMFSTSLIGHVCLGSMPTPASAGLECLAEWVEGFFRSEFTHSGATKLTKHPQGHFGLWRDLVGKDRFPTEWIMPSGALEEWLCRNQ